MDSNATNRIVRLKWLATIGGVLILGLAAIVISGSIPPSGFPVGAIITIPKDSGLSKQPTIWPRKG